MYIPEYKESEAKKMEQKLIDANKLQAEADERAEKYGIACINLEAAQTVLTIPENPTNGDMIQAMYDKEDIYKDKHFVFYGGEMRFSREWWNAPYKKESD